MAVLEIIKAAKEVSKKLEVAQKAALLQTEAELIASGVSYDVTLDTSDFDKKMKEFGREHPNYIKAGMRAVNRQVVKEVKNELRARGYLAHNPQSFGDAGFMAKGNVSFAVNKDMSAKIWFARNYYHMKFVEYGANVRWKNKRGSFNIMAKPSLTVRAKEYWETGKASDIIEKELQKKYDKVMGEK